MSLLLLLLAACNLGEAGRAEAEETVRDGMANHWEQGTAIADAVAQGDLDGARAAAAALQERLPMPGIPEAARPHEERLASTLTAISGSDDLALVAQHTGTLARTCGECHTQVGAKPVDERPPPEAAGSLPAEMQRHQWAAERMWLGLVTPDPSQFERAVDVLAEAPLIPSGTPADSPLPPLATELELAVHDLAQAAQSAPDSEARAARYGELLVTCATCHALIRDHRR